MQRWHNCLCESPILRQLHCGQRAGHNAKPTRQFFSKRRRLASDYGDRHRRRQNSQTCVVAFTLVDNTPPTITCPANIIRGTDANLCSAVVTFAATATDNCSGVGAAVCTPPSSSVFPKGVTTVTCSVRDAANNQSTACSFTVTVNDLQPPAIVCPANISVEAAPGQCSAAVTYAAPAVTDNCRVLAPVCTPPSGATFAKGTTVVNCTVRDAAANQGSCSFGLTVVDTQPPTMACATTLIANTINPGDAAVAVSFTSVASDNCPGVSVVCVPPSGSQFARGTTSVSCTATDSSNNQASCTFTVRVFDYAIVSDTNGKILRFDSQTGEYDFLDCRKGTSLSGRGVVKVQGCKVDLSDTGPDTKHPDRNVTASASYCTKTGSATIVYAGVTHTISDPNLSNNISTCP